MWRRGLRCTRERIRNNLRMGVCSRCGTLRRTRPPAASPPAWCRLDEHRSIVEAGPCVDGLRGEERPDLSLCRRLRLVEGGHAHPAGVGRLSQALSAATTKPAPGALGQIKEGACMRVLQMADEVRYPRMSTAELRSTFLLEDLFEADRVKLVYVDLDRTVIGSAVPLAVGPGVALSQGAARCHLYGEAGIGRVQYRRFGSCACRWRESRVWATAMRFTLARANTAYPSPAITQRRRRSSIC